MAFGSSPAGAMAELLFAKQKMLTQLEKHALKYWSRRTGHDGMLDWLTPEQFGLIE